LVDYVKLLLHEQNVPCAALIEHHARIDKRSRTRVCAVCPLHAMKAYRRVEVLDLIFNYRNIFGWVTRFTSRPFYFREKNLWCLLNGGTVVSSRVGLGVWGQRNVLPLPGFIPRIIQPIAWSLYWLRHFGFSNAMRHVWKHAIFVTGYFVYIIKQ